MEYEIKEVDYGNLDFKKLCIKLDEFQNKLVPERKRFGFNSLAGLEKLEIVLMIYDNDKPIASAALKPSNENIAEIARIFVEEKYRGKGLAKELISKIIEYAKAKGYKKLVLDTWKNSDAAISLYKKLGFLEKPRIFETLKNESSTEDEDKLTKLQELSVFMEKDI